MGPIEDAEVVTRFVLESRKLRSSGVHYRAFMPSPKDMATSVFRIRDLPEPEVWELGATEVAAPQRKPVLARGDLSKAQIESVPLTLDPDAELHVRHASIVGWPSEKQDQMNRAQILADLAVVSTPPS